MEQHKNDRISRITHQKNFTTVYMKYKVMMSTKEQNAAICLFDLVN